MNYQVVWTPDAEADLAAIWLNATQRTEVSAAANRLDDTLAINPANLGESRPGGIRITFSSPLAIEFEVHDADRRVFVVAVWVFRRRTDLA